MGDVIDLHEARESRRKDPHTVINCNRIGVPRIHVYPTQFFRDYAEGADLEIPPEVMRAIVHDWLIHTHPEGDE